ncbi:MAG: LysR substrate-binding domain-containing protein [Pseudomonadota bacterium]
MTPSLRGLRVFCEAARKLSFKSAADSLFITASAVSHQIKSLEQELGTELFVRGTRSLSLTPHGELLYERVAPLLAEISEACASLAARDKPVPIRIAAPPFFATERLIPRLPEMLAPDLGYVLEVTTTEGRPDRHPENTDVAVLLADSPPADTRSTSLFALELVPACAPAIADRLSNMDPADWLRETLIVHRSRASAWRKWFRQHQLTLKEPERVVLLDSMFAVARAAEQGLGIALVPQALARKWFQSGGLIRLAGSALETGDAYYLSWQTQAQPDVDIAGISRLLAAALTNG